LLLCSKVSNGSDSEPADKPDQPFLAVTGPYRAASRENFVPVAYAR
jgi:hypothetical protein